MELGLLFSYGNFVTAVGYEVVGKNSEISASLITSFGIHIHEQLHWCLLISLIIVNSKNDIKRENTLNGSSLSAK